MGMRKGQAHSGQFKKGFTPWNKGLSVHLNPNYEFKKGHTPSNKGVACSDGTKKRISETMKTRGIKPTVHFQASGKDNPKWRGDRVGYRTLHRWIERYLGKAEVCFICGSNGSKIKKCHWANLDHNYKRSKGDYMSLCPLCHKRWDMGRLPINLFEWNERRVAL